MITTSVRVKLVAFVIVGLLAAAYLGARYAGLSSLVGSGYQVRVELADAGGLFANGEVTYRGVPVGRIKSLHATSDGVEATLQIDSGAPPMPADPTITVADRSTIGEQYLDISGDYKPGSQLRGGDRIEATSATLPPDLSGLLQDAKDFTGSVPTKDLTTVINETYDLSHGVSGDLRRLVTTSQQFQKQADDNWLVSQALIHDATTVLATQKESAADIRSYSGDLDLIAKTLKGSDSDLRTLIQNSPDAARQLGQLIDQVGRPLGTLMGNLVSTAEIFGTNADGLRDTLVRAPEAISVGWAVNGSQGLGLGLVPTFFDPLPCTQGYGGTTMRSGTDTTAGQPLNLDAGCTASPSSGTDVLGPASLGSGHRQATARVSVPSTLGDLLGGDQ
jgi:phospholipid/cholesterol/gamma-HCH transport system substrate-binding protein